MVERPAFNRVVVGSIPTPGVPSPNQIKKTNFKFLFRLSSRIKCLIKRKNKKQIKRKKEKTKNKNKKEKRKNQIKIKKKQKPKKKILPLTIQS